MTERYEELLSRLESGRLDPGDFGHRDHVGVAVVALRRYPFFEAVMIIARGIEAAALRTGAPDKFNATITLASMSLIAERLESWGDGPVDDFVGQNAKHLAPSALMGLYGKERMTSPLARRVALLPVG